MHTKMAFCKELDVAAGSALVKDMMIVQFQREVAETLCEEGELRKKVASKRSRVAERNFVIEELQLLCGSDSDLLSITNLMGL